MFYMIGSWHQAQFQTLLARKTRLPHALLIRGPEGIGKLAFARALAQALLCERPAADGSACGACIACAWLGQGGHPDFRQLEPEGASQGGDEEQGGEKKASAQIAVEQVRDLADFINLSSHRGGARVVLIHPAEALNLNAANALLKNLEEPPPQTYFLLVAHRWHQLLPTIKSRCQQMVLPAPDAGSARAWLKAQGSHDPELAFAHSGGAPLLALKFDEDYWRARELLLDRIAASDFDPLDAAEQLRDLAPPLAVALLQKWSFDLAFHKVTGSVRYNPDRAEAVAAAVARLDALAALRFHRQLVRLQRVIHHPLNPRLFLEQLFLSYAELLRGHDLKQAA